MSSEAARSLQRAVKAALACDRQFPAGGVEGEAALFFSSLALAEQTGWLEDGVCVRWLSPGADELAAQLFSSAAIASLRVRSGGALPLGDPARFLSQPISKEAFESIAALFEPAPLESLSLAYEALSAAARGPGHRKEQGVYYTPPEVAAQLVSFAFAHAPSLPKAPRVFDCCAGAGIFLLAAARQVAARGVLLRHAALLCGGSDLDARALEVTRAQLALLAGPQTDAGALAAISLEPLDALLHTPARAPFDLLITNPPYGHVHGAEARARLVAEFPALAGAEIDLYAAFILRSLQLVRPGGSAVLLVPDTWMTNARSSKLRAAVLESATLCAVADLGKPFAAAKDTRVQAVVLQRREGASASAPTQTARIAAETGALRPLAPIEETELREKLKRGWQPYRSTRERALASAMEASSVPLESICTVGYGLRTGDNPRHVARGELPEGAIGLVGGEEIEPFRLARKPKWLRDPTPEHLRLAKKQLGSRRVAIQRIRTNAAAPWARWLEAAQVGADQVCLDSLSTLALPAENQGDDELLWALLGLASSVALNRYHRLQTTDVNVKPSALRRLPAPARLSDASERAKLVALSQERSGERDPIRAHALERAIDREVYRLYALDDPHIDEAERGFWGLRHDAERALL